MMFMARTKSVDFRAVISRRTSACTLALLSVPMCEMILYVHQVDIDDFAVNTFTWFKRLPPAGALVITGQPHNVCIQSVAQLFIRSLCGVSAERPFNNYSVPNDLARQACQFIRIIRVAFSRAFSARAIVALHHFAANPRHPWFVSSGSKGNGTLSISFIHPLRLITTCCEAE